jgi:DNA polymerase-3 subunit beta
MPKAKPTSSSTLHVDRKRLLTALTRVGWVTPNHTYKPVLQGVRLEASDGKLRLSATDAEVSLSMTLDAEGDLPPCLVSCPELIRRLKAGKGDTCAIRLEPKGDAIVVNGGRVDHTIRTMELQDHPPVSTEPDGQAITLPAQALKDALSIALVAAATETSRYAIQGVRLESDKNGTRFVATDGRRLVMTELDPARRQFRGKVIVPSRVAWLAGKLIDAKATGDVRVFVKEDPGTDRAKQPADVYLVGPDWILSSPELEGHFPVYRDVVPKSHS